MKNKFCIIILTLAFFYTSNIIKAQTFTNINAELTGTIFSASAWGDYDNDGDLDIIITGSSSSVPIDFISKIYRNDGNGIFTDINAGISGINSGSVAWGDYDNDGDLDLLISGSGTQPLTKIYRNEGNDIFTDINAGLTGAYSSSVAWGDSDNDGLLDFIMIGGDVANPNWYISKIYHNNGDGTFTDINASFIIVGNTFGNGSVTWGDYDNDGDLDILVSASTYNGFHTKIYRNDGNALFTDINAGLIGLYQSSVAFGDYDNDGDLDILISGREASSLVSKIYRNDGNGSFVDINAGLTGVDECSVAWGDYDNDGDLDALICGYEGGPNDNRITKIYRNDGNNVFTEDVSLNLDGVSFSSIVWGDYDNDGDLDILISGSDNSFMPICKIYRNDITTPNNIPTVPTGLTYSISGYNATLSWNKATDSETPQNGLSYNVFIGTTPSEVDVASPMANITTGYRRVVNFGNACEDTTWTVRNLQPGTYFWNVQSIDHAFAGSPFAAAVSSFTILENTISENETPVYNVYPNPNNGLFTIKFIKKPKMIEIFNLLGELVYSNNIVMLNNEVDLSSYNKGIYYIKIRVGDKKFLKKIAIQ